MLFCSLLLDLLLHLLPLLFDCGLLIWKSHFLQCSSCESVEWHVRLLQFVARLLRNDNRQWKLGQRGTGNGVAVKNNSKSWYSWIWLNLMAINKCILCSKQANRIRCWTARCSIKHHRASKSSASKALTAASSRTLSWRFMWTERHAIPKFTNQSELSERRSQRSHD